MDTTTVIDKYTQDISNLPLEVKYIFEELKNKDNQLMEARKRYQAKDNQLHKFIKQNGTNVKHPKEQQLYGKIEEDMKLVMKIQNEKILLANTALFLISKHLFNFETDITKLERDDLLPPIESVYDIDGGNSDYGTSLGISESISATPTPRPSSSTPITETVQRKQKRKAIIKNESSSRHEGQPDDNDGDNQLYCFCQRVSFGEMIACDNDDCRFEWFHWQCVGITSTPKDNEVWYCPDCSKKMAKQLLHSRSNDDPPKKKRKKF